VLSVEQVVAVKEAGGQIIVMPHCDTAVIRRARALGMYCAPGVATPTEAFTAIEHGANAIKLFPAEQITPEVTKAWRAVIPQSVPMLPVGGITPETMARYLSHGANGFGLGSALYHPGMTPEQVYENAVLFMNAWNNLNSN
jgi:2-dehydro-3-deoxyphosphogalactonate aldolase